MLDAGLFAAVTEMYSNLDLGNDSTAYNFIQVGGAKAPGVNAANFYSFSIENFRAAIEKAGETEENDIIVVYTGSTEATNTLNLDGEALEIDWDSEEWGNVAIVSLGIDSDNPAPLTLNAQGQSTVFSITSDDVANVTLAGLTMTGGNNEDGGAIEFWADGDGTLTITQSTFEENYADYDGGAILFYTEGDGTLTITDSTFKDNTASGGGAIYFETDEEAVGTLTIANSTFEDNSANCGGAIGFSAGDAILTITDSTTFKNNTAEEEGGAIEVWVEENGTFTVTDTIFEGNSAEFGGAILFHSYGAATFTITDSIFESNGNESNGNEAWYGGAIDFGAEYGTLSITGSTFNDNTAEVAGGAIFFWFEEGEGTLTITNSTFTGNTAEETGGAIAFIVEEEGTLTIADSTFTGNTAPEGDYNGAIYADGGTVTVMNCTFDDDTQDVKPAAPPSNLAVSNKTHNSVTLTWTNVSDATGYQIRYYKVPRSSGPIQTTEIEWSEPATYSSPARITGLEPETEYAFQIRAGNAAGYSDWSEYDVSETTNEASDTPVPDTGYSIATAFPVTFDADGNYTTEQAIRYDGVQIYKLTITAADLDKTFSFKTSPHSEDDEWFDTYLCLFDSAGKLLAENDDDDYGEFEGYSRILYQFTAAGTYYLGVSEYEIGDDGYNPNTSTAGTDDEEIGYYALTIGLFTVNTDSFTAQSGENSVTLTVDFDELEELVDMEEGWFFVMFRKAGTDTWIEWQGSDYEEGGFDEDGELTITHLAAGDYDFRLMYSLWEEESEAEYRIPLAEITGTANAGATIVPAAVNLAASDIEVERYSDEDFFEIELWWDAAPNTAYLVTCTSHPNVFDPIVVLGDDYHGGAGVYFWGTTSSFEETYVFSVQAINANGIAAVGTPPTVSVVIDGSGDFDGPPDNAHEDDLAVYNDLTSRGCDDGDFVWNSAGRITEIYVIGYDLTGTLDVSGLTALAVLNCNDNALTALNVNGLTALEALFCRNNLLTALDVSTNTALKNLYCETNLLTELDLTGTPFADFESAARTGDAYSFYQYYYESLPGFLTVDPDVTLINRTDGTLPAPAVTVTSQSPTQIVIGWNNNTLADGYEVKWSATDNEAGATPGTAVQTGSTWTFTLGGTDVNAGSTYYFWVRALGDGENWENSNWTKITAETSNKLPSPQVTVTGGTNMITVSWANVTNADGYIVRWNTVNDFTPGAFQSAETNNTSYPISGLTPGTYWVQVIAKGDGTSVLDSNPSVAQSVVVTSGTTPSPKPAKPVITAVVQSNTSVRLSGFEAWEYYIIQYGIEGNNGKVKTWMTLTDDIAYGDYEATGSTVTISGLLAGTKYQFRVIRLEYGETIAQSDWSDVAKATTTGSATVLTGNDYKINKATDANKTNKNAATKTSVTVSWGVIAGITDYVITYTIPSGVKGAPGMVVQETVTSNSSNTANGILTYKIEGLKQGASYKVSIVGQNDAGAVTKAVTVTQKTQKETVKAPAKFGAVRGEKPTIDTVKLTWDAVTGAEYYIIQVWSPKTKTAAPTLVRYIHISAADYASATEGGLANGWMIGGLTAGTKYTFAVQAGKYGSGYNHDTDTYASPGWETAFASKSISTAKYAGPKLNLSKGTVTLPNYKAPFDASNYTHYELYYVDSGKNEVLLGTFTLPSGQVQPRAKIDLDFSTLSPTADYSTFVAGLSSMGKTKVQFVLKAVTMDSSGATVNWSSSGTASMRADYVSHVIF